MLEQRRPVIHGACPQRAMPTTLEAHVARQHAEVRRLLDSPAMPPVRSAELEGLLVRLCAEALHFEAERTRAQRSGRDADARALSEAIDQLGSLQRSVRRRLEALAAVR